MRPPWTLPLALVLLAGCSGSAEPAAAPSPTPAATAPAVQAQPTCPATPSTLNWPEPVPADLPVPPTATGTEVQKRDGGVTVVTFTTAISLRQSVLFLIEQMPEAGYTLARGDAENIEADAPFIKGDVRGVMRMLAVGPCRTDWLMALSTGASAGGGTPLLPPRPGASPLPFG